MNNAGPREKKLETLEKEKCFNELDVKISVSKVSAAISKLKCNKAAGLDAVTNNMLKAGQSFLLNSLVSILNARLTHSIYTDAWAEGYVVPLHKAGDTHDPNNYINWHYYYKCCWETAQLDTWSKVGRKE